MLTLWRELPIESRWNPLAFECVGHCLPREQSSPVYPGPQIGGDRHIGRCGDDVTCEVAVISADFIQDGAKARLRGHARLDRNGQAFGHLKGRSVQTPRTPGSEGHTIKD